VISAGRDLSSAAVADHYDELDEFYRDVWGDHVHHGLWLRGTESHKEATLQLVRHVAERAHIGRDTRVCDIGCGYGATARMLAADYGARGIGGARGLAAQSAGGWELRRGHRH
jgi:tocopherol O-methyltransferase